MGDWAAEIAAWFAETSTCTRCHAPLVRSGNILGTWIARTGIARGVCTDGEPHRAVHDMREATGRPLCPGGEDA